MMLMLMEFVMLVPKKWWRLVCKYVTKLLGYVRCVLA